MNAAKQSNSTNRNEGTVGANLVAQVAAYWSHIDHQPWRALVKMALTAKDKPTPEVAAALYFGGHEGLVPVLLFKPGTKHTSKLRAVRDAVAVLEAVGAVMCVKQATSGDNAVYKLTLDASPKPAPKKRRRSSAFAEEAEERPPTQMIKQAEERPPTEAEHVPPPEAEERPPTEAEDAAPPPYKEEETLEEPLEERKEESGVEVRTDLTVTRANSAEQQPDPKSSACRDPTCQLGYLYDRTKPKRQRNIPCPTCRPGKVIPFPRKDNP